MAPVQIKVVYDYYSAKRTTALQSTRFTHERSFNEDCILHLRIPFFNWINVFL